MSYISNSSERRGEFSPLRSCSFWFASILCLGAIAIDSYLIYRHWHTAPKYVAFILSTPIGAQLIYQWFRMLRGCTKYRELCASVPTHEKKDETVLEIAGRLFLRETVDQLTYFYGVAIFALVLIGFLLSRLDGLR